MSFRIQEFFWISIVGFEYSINNIEELSSFCEVATVQIKNYKYHFNSQLPWRLEINDFEGSASLCFRLICVIYSEGSNNDLFYS